MKIKDARQLIKELQEYVDIYENYQPKNLVQDAVKLYAEMENVNGAAKRLNEMGYTKEGKLVAGKRSPVKLDSNDVTELLVRKVGKGDLLHPIVKKALNRNRKRKGIVL